MAKEKSAARQLGEAEQARINRLFYDVLGENGAPEIMEYLGKRFAKRSMVKRAEGMVDVNGTMVQCGAYELLTFIQETIEFGAKGK